MDELARQLESLRPEIEPGWDDQRSERLYAGLGKLRRRRQQQRAVLGATCLVLITALGGVAVRSFEAKRTQLAERDAARGVGSDAAQPAAILRGRAQASELATPNGSTTVAPTAHVSAGRRVWLSDGSLVQVASASGDLEVMHDEKLQIALRLHEGSAHFEVVPNKQRKFVVSAADVQVAVVGTVFDVERAQDRVRVAVSEGKVRVSVANVETFVAAGESRWFDAAGMIETRVPPTELAPGEALEPEHAPARELKRRAVRTSGAVTPGEDARGAGASWRSLSQNGDYAAAYRSIEQGASVRNDPAELMDAADAARLSGHPEVAVTYLRRVVREHGGSPVAPLAAFTLGRVQLERLGQPAEAASSFATARSLAPQGSLAQDALAREVEALSKAGEAHQAYVRAQKYVEMYPNGRRLRAVQLYGGLERE